MKSGIALQASGLTVCQGQGVLRRQVLHGMDLDIPLGRWTCIVGPNGAGKSTLLAALAGLLPVAAGQVHWRGHPLNQIAPRQRATQLAWLGQPSGDAAADDLTVYDVVMLGRMPHLSWWSSPGPADHAAVERALRQTQAWDWACRPLGALSSGERQRVRLARCLAGEAEIVLMDEPLANLDPPHQADWLAWVRQWLAQGRTLVSVLHELNMVLQADDLVVLQDGHLRHHGPCADADAHRALEGVFDDRLQVVPVQGTWVALPR